MDTILSCYVYWNDLSVNVQVKCQWTLLSHNVSVRNKKRAKRLGAHAEMVKL